MKLLLDTHFLIWSIEAGAKIRPGEQQAIDAASSVLVSVVSLWEVRIKWQVRDRHGVRKGNVDPAVALAFVEDNDMGPVPLIGEDSDFPLIPPLGHRDPFDEMLMVQAGRLGARLLTRDRLLVDHPLAFSA